MTGLGLVSTCEIMAVWCAAYFLHSSILIAGAWLLGRLLGPRRLEIQEAVWRVALVGGLVTATVQMATGLRPMGGEFQLAAFSTATQIAEEYAMDLSTPGTATTSLHTGEVVAAAALESQRSPSGLGRNLDKRSSVPISLQQWPVLLVTAWILGALGAATGLARARVRLLRLMQTGRSMPSGRLICRLARLMGVKREITVRVSPAFETPFASGVFKPEICVPESTARELSPAELENLLAHEMAHIARNDPAWIVLCRLLGSVLFFQPMNRVARRRLEILAECLCDDRAILCTGKPLDLARCLLHVAGSSRRLKQPLLAAAAVVSRSRLGHRIERLLRPPTGGIPCGRWITVALIVGLLGGTAVLPAISASGVAAPAPVIIADSSGGIVPPPSEGPEPVAPVETAERVAELAAPEPSMNPEPRLGSGVESLVLAERLEMLAQLEAEVAASGEASAVEVERQKARDEAALAAAAEEATRAINEHLAALENRTLDLEQAKDAIRHEMQALQRHIRELNREREKSQEEMERHRAEARRLAKERRPDREGLDRRRAELRERQRELEIQMVREQRLASEEKQAEREAIRRLAIEAVRRDIEQRKQAEFLAQQQAELERQDKEQDEQQKD